MGTFDCQLIPAEDFAEMGLLHSSICLLVVLGVTNCFYGFPDRSLKERNGRILMSMVPTGDMISKRRMEMNARGFGGDYLSGGFGDFYTMKRSAPRVEQLEEKLDYLIDLFSHKQE